MSRTRSGKSSGPREIFVRVSPLPAGKKNDFNLSDLKKEYDKEVSDLKGWNLFSGGGIGAAIGLVACMASSIVGIPVTSPEAFSIVGGSLMLGIIAGFILY